MRLVKLGFWLFCLSMISVSCLTNISLEDDLRKSENQKLILDFFSKNGVNPSMLDDGSYYAITKSIPSGETVQRGDSVIIRYEIANLATGEILDSTGMLTEGKPLIYRYGFANPIFTKLIPLLKEGEEALMCLPGTPQSLPGLPSYTPTRITIKSFLVRSEIDRIDEYIQEKSYATYKKLANGYRYIQLKGGSGDSSVNGQKLYLKYTGKFLSDYTFDGNNFKTDSLKHTVGGSGLVDGFAYTVEHMLPGEKGIAIFPSKLGYGENGSGSKIPPFSSLVFEIELVKRE